MNAKPVILGPRRSVSSCHTGEGPYLRPQWVPTFVGMAMRMIFELPDQIDTLVPRASASRGKRVGGVVLQ
jgi:hypothetical protein